VVTAPDGARIAYEVAGGGPPVALVHGITESRRAYTPGTAVPVSSVRILAGVACEHAARTACFAAGQDTNTGLAAVLSLSAGTPGTTTPVNGSTLKRRGRRVGFELPGCRRFAERRGGPHHQRLRRLARLGVGRSHILRGGLSFDHGV
jgi:pimeloyl-ACP methyl ester carboxylesterase